MRFSNIPLALALGALCAGAGAAEVASLGPGQILAVGDRLVCAAAKDVVADLEPDQAQPKDVGGPRLTVRNGKTLRAATPPIVDITLDGETFILVMSQEGTLFLYSRLAGRPDQELWRNTFDGGKWGIPGSRLELGKDGVLRILAPDGRVTWQSFRP